MQAGTAVLTGFAEATVSESVDVSGVTYTLRGRQVGEGVQMGTLAGTATAVYQNNKGLFTTPVIIPIDYMP